MFWFGNLGFFKFENHLRTETFTLFLRESLVVSLKIFKKRDIYTCLYRINSFDQGTKKVWIDKRT
ncbi:unnamed protein product, partial [Brassica rapa subsp. trilocularis]